MKNAIVPVTLYAQPEIEVGRDIYVTRHAFADPVPHWIADGTCFDDMVAEVFPQDELAAHAIVLVDGIEIPREDWTGVPTKKQRVELVIPARKGLVRGIIRAIVVFAVYFVVTFLAGPLAGEIAAATVGNFLGNLLANALVPPARPPARLDTPTVNSIDGARNTARPNQSMPLILGTHRFMGDIIVPFYQEIVGEEIYIRGAVCWGVGDYALTDLKIGDTLLSNFEGVQIQHSLTEVSPTPTLIPGIPAPLSVGANLDDDEWNTRTTAPDAEEIELILYFPEGVGWLKKGEKKRNHTVQIEIRYREAPAGGSNPTWRTTNAASIDEADGVALGLGYPNRRGLFGGIGSAFLTDFHTGLDNAGGGGQSLTRSFTRAAPSEPFFASVKFAVPPGKQYEVEVRRKSPLKNDTLFFEDVTWTAMNTWKEGNPLPNPKVAVTAIRIKAQDELSGVVDTLNAVVSNMIPTYSEPSTGAVDASSANFVNTGISSNGADQLLHVSMGGHQAHPTPANEINWPAFAWFWDWCNDNGFTFDFVETSGRRKGDLQQLIGTACRARIMRIGGLLTPVIDGPKPQGPRTILSPDNAKNFSFNKIFPADVHALNIQFPNKDNGYRNDDRTVYLDGHTKSTATKYEPFGMDGVVDAALIFKHAHYFANSAKLQTLSGSCVQDIEGGMILRYGDRVAVRHSTLSITSESGFVSEVFTNQGGEITGFRLPESVAVNETDVFVARWRKIGTDLDGELYISSDHLETLSIDTGSETEIGTNVFMFSTPVSADIGVEVGGLVVVGILGEETEDALVRGVEAVDEKGQYFNIHWTLYAEVRFEDVTVPAHTPLLPPVLNVRPAAPVFESNSANNEGIFVGFSVVPVAGATLAKFEVWFRETPETGGETPWRSLPSLPPSARTVTLLPGRPGQSFDVKVVAVSSAGLRSDPVKNSGLQSR